jgi:hypothetical protein
MWSLVRLSWQWLGGLLLISPFNREYIRTKLSGPASGRFTPLKHGDELACCDGFDRYHLSPQKYAMVPTFGVDVDNERSWERNSDPFSNPAPCGYHQHHFRTI